MRRWSRFKGGCRAARAAARGVRIAPKGERPEESDDKIETVVQPDVFLVRDRGKTDERGVRGAPDWLAEVLSPSTASYDQKVKIPRYERAGVREVWLIQPEDLTLAIYRLANGRYERPLYQDLKGQIPISAVPGVTIDWDRIMARLL